MIKGLINRIKISWYQGKADAAFKAMTRLSISYCMPHHIMMSSERYAAAHYEYVEIMKVIEQLQGQRK